MAAAPSAYKRATKHCYLGAEFIAGSHPMRPLTPAHPCEVIRQACLAPLNLTVTDAADAVGVTRKVLSDLLNGHSGVTPDMAIRLEQVFGDTADSWLRMQLQTDLEEVRARAPSIKVNRTFTHPTP